jgi:hypothetical protein
MTQPSTHLHPRAEVVGYSEPVLAAFRDLVHEIQIDPELALGSGLMMDALKGSAVVVRDGRPSELMGRIGALVTTAAEVAIDEKGSDQ